MLKWQKDGIRKNLPKLLESTQVTYTLLSLLEAESILHTEEVQDLQNERFTNVQKAEKLYKLLESRTDSFDKLMNALSETNQTGALHLLFRVTQDGKDYGIFRKLAVGEHIGVICNTVVNFRGSFGLREVIVKTYPKDSSDCLQQAINEVKVLSSIDWHPNILRCFVAESILRDSSRKFAIALDYEKTLEHYLEGVASNTNICRSLVTQCVNGVKFLRKTKILHLNLKSQNIFISRECVKIGEFGLSRNLQDQRGPCKVDAGVLESNGAASFNTPEVLKECKNLYKEEDATQCMAIVGFYTDVFCLAQLVYYILSGKKHAFGKVFEQKSNILKNVLQVDEVYLNNMSAKGKTILMKMFSKTPNDRPDVATIGNLFKTNDNEKQVKKRKRIKLSP